MANDKDVSASKEDIRLLIEQIGTYYDKTEQRIDNLEEKIDVWKEELKEHFDLVAENMKHDFQGAFHDKLEQHEDRIVRLEQHSGLRGT